MTTIKTLASDRTISTEPSAEGSNALFIRTHQDLYGGMGVHIKHADLIEVIEQEVGGIFLKDADLPEVTTGTRSDNFRVGGTLFSLEGEVPDELEKIGKTYLAAARHIRANQPVIDQEQVDAFNKALVEVEMDHPDGPVPYKVAQDLVKAGYKIVKEG